MSNPTSKEHVYQFDRYVNGRLMAAGVTIRTARSLKSAIEAATRLADPGYGCVLVLRPLDETGCAGESQKAAQVSAPGGDRSRLPGTLTPETGASLENLQQARLKWAAKCLCSCPACEELHDLIRDEYDDAKVSALESTPPPPPPHGWLASLRIGTFLKFCRGHECRFMHEHATHYADCDWIGDEIKCRECGATEKSNCRPDPSAADHPGSGADVASVNEGSTPSGPDPFSDIPREDA